MYTSIYLIIISLILHYVFNQNILDDLKNEIIKNFYLQIMASMLILITIYYTILMLINLNHNHMFHYMEYQKNYYKSILLYYVLNHYFHILNH